MTERITDEQVADLIALLRTDASVDAKVQQVTVVKSSIKQQIVPDSCILPLFEALRIASSSQHALLVNAGFTALNHLFTRLARQDPKTLIKEGARTLPLIVEKMGDQKEKFRQLALQALVTLYKVAPVEVERSVRNTAMVGKNPRAKEASLHWLLQVYFWLQCRRLHTQANDGCRCIRNMASNFGPTSRPWWSCLRMPTAWCVRPPSRLLSSYSSMTPSTPCV